MCFSADSSGERADSKMEAPVSMYSGNQRFRKKKTIAVQLEPRISEKFWGGRRRKVDWKSARTKAQKFCSERRKKRLLQKNKLLGSEEEGRAGARAQES